MTKYSIVLTSRYKKSLKRFLRNKDFSLDKLEKVVKKLSESEKLDLRHKDHQLIGSLKDFRECHIQNDILLVYQKHDDVLILLLVDIGSHSSLFK